MPFFFCIISKIFFQDAGLWYFMKVQLIAPLEIDLYVNITTAAWVDDINRD